MSDAKKPINVPQQTTALFSELQNSMDAYVISVRNDRPIPIQLDRLRNLRDQMLDACDGISIFITLIEANDERH